MEHRKGLRIPICLNVSLRKGNKDLGWYETGDFGAEGLSLKGRIYDLPNNSLVSVSIDQHQDAQPENYVFKALVVHQELNSVGLMWVDFDPGFAHRILELVKQTA